MLRLAKRSLLLPVLLVLVTACRAAPTDEELDAATLYFPPTVKHVEQPQWCFSVAERMRALRDYRKSGSDTLFELIIDADGNVVRSRLLRTKIDKDYRSDMENHAKRFRFSPEPGSTLFRAFFLPLEYDFNATFEWI